MSCFDSTEIYLNLFEIYVLDICNSSEIIRPNYGPLIVWFVVRGLFVTTTKTDSSAFYDLPKSFSRLEIGPIHLL